MFARQVVQYTESELLSDVQVAGPCLSFNRYREYSPREEEGKSFCDRAENMVDHVINEHRRIASLMMTSDSTIPREDSVDGR